MLQFSAVLQDSFRFAVFPKKLITFNPMQYVKLRGKKEETDIFSDSEEETVIPTITQGEYQKLADFLTGKKHPALLAVQIAYYAGLRIGEVCGLTWQDINLDEQYLTVRRSMRYNGTRHKHEVGTTKRSKVRTVDFCDTLADILRKAKTEQHKNRFRYGELYHLNYCKTVKEKGRTYYEVYSLQRTQGTPEDDRELSFVCLKEDVLLFLQVQSVRFAARQRQRSRDWRTFISTHSAIPTQAICFQAVQNPKMCRNFSDTLSQYHNEHLCPLYQRSKADFRKALG